MKTGIYAYAVLGKPAKIGNIPIDTSLKLLTYNNLQLAYKEIDLKKAKIQIEKAAKDLAVLKKMLEDHGMVVERLSLLQTVIPFRFGSILKDTAAAEKLLKQKGDFFSKTLAKLSGKEEWGVKLYKGKKKEGHSVPKSGKEYLMKIKQQQLGKQETVQIANSAAKEIIENVKGICDQININDQNRQAQLLENLLFNSSFLIERKDRNNFKNKVVSLKRKYQPEGLSVVISGPWPPFSFI